MVKVKVKKKSKKFYDYTRDGITQGLLITWMECREKARWFLKGYSSKYTSLALTYGSIGHGVLERAYENFRAGKCSGIPSTRQVRKYLGQTEKIWKLENPNPSKFMLQDLETSLAFAEVILPVYFEYWAEDFKKKNWQKIEGTFKVSYELNDGRKTFLRGMIDGMFKTRSMWLFESKFKSIINEADIIDTLPLDLQVMLYLWALLQKYKSTPAGVLYNIVRRFNLRQGKNETLKQFSKRCAQDVKSRPEWYFYRFEVAITKEDLARFDAELHEMVREFCDWCDGQTGHYKNPHSCITKYGRCWALEACSNGDMYKVRKRKVVFRELEDV